MLHELHRTEPMLFENIPIHIVRVPFLRRITVKLAPDQPVIVKTGVLTSQKLILEFLNGQKTWIEQKLQKMKEIEAQTPRMVLREGQPFLFLGEYFPLRVALTLQTKAFFFLHDHDQEVRPTLYLPREAWAKHRTDLIYPWLDLVSETYKEKAIQSLTPIVQFWSKEMNLRPSQLQFRAQKTRWGSCSSQRTLSLNWKLILFSRAVIDYVIIHELAHLQHMNHSQEFWKLVGTYCPNHKKYTRYLRKNFNWTAFLGG